jgi:hypothetical protein
MVCNPVRSICTTCASRSRSQSVSPASRTESCPQSNSTALYPPANGVGADAARSTVTGTGAPLLLPAVLWSAFTTQQIPHSVSIHMRKRWAGQGGDDSEDDGEAEWHRDWRCD